MAEPGVDELVVGHLVGLMNEAMLAMQVEHGVPSWRTYTPLEAKAWRGYMWLGLRRMAGDLSFEVGRALALALHEIDAAGEGRTDG